MLPAAVVELDDPLHVGIHGLLILLSVDQKAISTDRRTESKLISNKRNDDISATVLTSLSNKGPRIGGHGRFVESKQG